MIYPTDPTKRCDMGVGCEEAGVCYAEAHGQPERCNLYVRPIKTELTLDEMAKELYDDCQTVKQNWSDLSDTTKAYWIEEAERGRCPEGWSPLVYKPPEE